MFLKRLEISGFKSFAAKSILDFEKGEPVAIVGPNGSGKSNCADAIRWVLGEQSYKSVRAKKSEDVIFSGSNGKAKASMARVSMILDNSDGKAPIDFSEVEISRAIYRDGTGEYLLNGKKARLLDVAELLAKSGFGQSTYSVIGQGMVDSMLFYGPAERKVLFDEAAGVRQYELKREQTIRKLEGTTGNIIRIRDILSELNPRLSTLKRQAEKASEKDNIKTELLEKQKVYFSTVWDKISQSEKEHRTDLEKISAEETKLQTELAELNREFNEILEGEKSKTDNTENLQKQIRELESGKDVFRQKIFTLRAKMEFASSSLTKKEIESKIQEHQKEIDSLELEKLEVQKSKIEAEIKKQKTFGFDIKIKELQSKKDTLRQEIFTLRVKMEVGATGPTKKEIETKVKELTGRLDGLQDKALQKEKTEIEKKIKVLQEKQEDLGREITAKKDKINLLSAEIEKFDFSVVGEKLSTILYLQNDFMIKIAAAKNIREVGLAAATGKKVAERLKELRKQVGDAKEGRISSVAIIQRDLEKILSEKEKITDEIAILNAKVWKLEFEIKKADNERFDIEKELGHFNTLKPTDDNHKNDWSQTITHKEKEIEGLEEEIESLREKSGRLTEIKEELVKLDYEIRHETDKKNRFLSEIERLNNLKPAQSSEKKQFEKEIEENEAEIKKLETKIEDIRQKINEGSNSFESQSRKLAEIKDKLSEKQQVLAEYSNEVANLRVELAKFDTKKQDIREEISRDLGSEAVLADAKIVPELDELKAREEIEKLKGKLYTIGEIDPEVKSEFEEVGSRVGFLTTQMEDLEKAKNDLEKLISDLDHRIKKQFESSFSAISDKFSHFFKLLFDGGTASLDLVRQKDEESGEEQFGIEITAVPPGKRIKSLSALSGGERTLTSLALLFAILSVNPAPFCVLDEVDAALDETNTKKFLKIVSELAKTTQFIFITHNRETMKTANLIYGITVDETQASRLLSIKLADALKTENTKKKVPVTA